MDHGGGDLARQERLFGDPGEDRPTDSRELLPHDGSAILHTGVISSPAATETLHTLIATLAWSERTVRVFGRYVPQPRLTAWHGDPGATYRYSGLQLDPEPWTPLLTEIRDICEQLSGARFNSVLANLYRDGHDTVSWHADDEPELGNEPTIASVSLGAARRFHLRHRTTRETVHVELPAGSVLVMSGPTQHHWEHQLPRSRRIHDPRINLTYRWIHTAPAAGSAP